MRFFPSFLCNIGGYEPRKGLVPPLNIKKLVPIGLLAGLILAGLWLGIDLYRYAHQPSDPNGPQVLFSITPGEKFDTLAARLGAEGIITDIQRFKLFSRFRGDDKRLKSGEYQLTASMSPSQVLDELVSGKTFLHRLTIPEGYNLKQIAAEVARQKLGDADEIMALATNRQITSTYNLQAPNLEGYLFPDTYHFPKGVSARTIITKMIQRFKEQFQPHWHARAQALGLTDHQIVTLASIIEKETGDPSERPIIASVFHNRLKKKMRLESDPTVIYGIPDFDGNIKRRHLSTPTPYNTYTIKGLPPGPIASPGRASIEAALYPKKTAYLFFVAKKDGTHHFSANIKEHNRAVRKYQLRRRRKSVP